MWPFNRKAGVAPISVAAPWFIPIDWAGRISKPSDVTDKKLWQYYQNVPEFQNVVNYRAKVMAGMQVKAFKGDREVELPDVIAQPNVFQSWPEFFEQLSISKDVFGNALVYTLYGTNVKNTKALYVLPAADFKPELTDALPFQVTSYNELIKHYNVVYNKKNYKFEPSECIHFFDNLDSSTMKGVSKAAVLSQLFENIITSNEGRGLIMGNSALGIISNETEDASGTRPLTATEIKEVQDKFRDYGLKKDKYQFIITSQRLKYQSFGTSMRNLGLFDEVSHGLNAVCNQYGFPAELLLNGVTYENKKEAKKQLYQDSIIPEVNSWLIGLASGLELDVELRADWSHIAVLQDDYESKASVWNTTTMALNRAFTDGVITIDEYRDVLIKANMI